MSGVEAPSPRSTAPRRPLHLFRHFLVLAIGAVAAILLLVGAGFNTVLIDSVVSGAQDDAISVADALRDSLWTDGFLERSPDELRGLIVNEAEKVSLDGKMRSFLRPFDILKIKVFDRTGEIVYSTEPTIIGEVDDDNPNLALALNAIPVSKLESKDSVCDLANEERLDIDVVETYVPVCDRASVVVGAFDIYKDVTPYLTKAHTTLLRHLEHPLRRAWCPRRGSFRSPRTPGSSFRSVNGSSPRRASRRSAGSTDSDGRPCRPSASTSR